MICKYFDYHDKQKKRKKKFFDWIQHSNISRIWFHYSQIINMVSDKFIHSKLESIEREEERERERERGVLKQPKAIHF